MYLNRLKCKKLETFSFPNREELRRQQMSEKIECTICLCHFVSGDYIVFCYNAYYVYHASCFKNAMKQKCPGCKDEIKSFATRVSDSP